MHLEETERLARKWAENFHPDTSPQHLAAFVNSVTYALYRMTGRFGGPSVREHVATTALGESETIWEDQNTLYAFLDPLIYGPIQEAHVTTWSLLRDICFDDDPKDREILTELVKHAPVKKDGRYETMRVWPQTLRKLRIVAAMCNETTVKSVDRLVNEELARLRYQRKEAN